MELICKPDGSWKKIIFYNTTVTALLQYNEKYLEKMRDVFRVFYENRNEVVLLWRPHPLLGATIESMRPQLREEYKQIVESYRSDGWGIYDDTSDLDRAVVLSDGYYGDGSSVVQLFQLIGKQYMIQNVYSLPDNNVSLAMDNLVEYQNAWWFLALKDNGIYRLEKGTLRASLIIRIPWDEKMHNAGPQYGKICIYKNKIYVIPWVQVKIAVYDMDKKSYIISDIKRN